MSSTLAHPYRDPGQYRLPPERPLERSSSGKRRGWLVASLAAHVSIVLLVICPSKIEQVQASPRPPEVAMRVDLRLAQLASTRRHHDYVSRCAGFPPEPYESTESVSAAPTVPPPLLIAPRVLQRLLIAGDTQMQPSEQVRLQMLRDGITRIHAVAKVCIGTDGAVGSAFLLRPTRYAEYDDAVLSALHSRRYRPYLRDGVAQPACSTVAIRRLISP